MTASIVVDVIARARLVTRMAITDALRVMKRYYSKEDSACRDVWMGLIWS